MDGLSGIHKLVLHSFSKVRLAASAINTGTFKWAYFFVPLQKPFASNDYTVQDTFDFTEDISQQNSQLSMASLNIKSLFTRCYSTKLSRCVKKLFKTRQWISGLNKQEMHFSDAFINYEEKHFIWWILL